MKQQHGQITISISRVSHPRKPNNRSAATNSIYKIKYLLFMSWDWEAWCLTQSGGKYHPPPPKETLLEIRGGNVFTA